MRNLRFLSNVAEIFKKIASESLITGSRFPRGVLRRLQDRGVLNHGSRSASHRQFWSFVLAIDQDLAETTRKNACPCGGRLHCANASFSFFFGDNLMATESDRRESSLVRSCREGSVVPASVVLAWFRALADEASGLMEIAGYRSPRSHVGLVTRE